MKVINHGTNTFLFVMDRESAFNLAQFIYDTKDTYPLDDVTDTVEMVRSKVVDALMHSNHEEALEGRRKRELENIHEVS